MLWLKKFMIRSGERGAVWIFCGLVLLAVILAVFFAPAGFRVGFGREESITFVEGFNYLGELDKKHNASFRDERLNVSVVELKNIDPLLGDLEKFRRRLLKAENSTDRNALLLLVDIRKSMLESEKNWDHAINLGDIGVVTDAGGFSCSEIEYILTAANYYNTTWRIGLEAYSKLDDLLYIYRNVTRMRELVGINEDRPMWYRSPFDHVKNMWRDNILAMEQYCGYDYDTQTVKITYRKKGDDELK